VPDPNLLEIERGAVTAPAGCGKTELIKNALLAHDSHKPILVLTHTNAGVAALRTRLERAAVPRSAFRLATIDGWAMRLLAAFPGRSGHRAGLLDVLNQRRDYPEIRAAAGALVRSGHLDEVLRASYARVIVDEYQDCSLPQHRIVLGLAELLPTCVLGDPLQAIFDFAEPVVDWERDVHGAFAPAGTLDAPWRWRNAGAEPLGQWLLDVRGHLLAGHPIDLRTAPPNVCWMVLDGTNDDATRREACRFVAPVPNGRVLVLGEAANPRGQQALAGQTPGAVTVEAVALADLIAFGQRFNLGGADPFSELLNFASGLMTNLGAAELRRRLDALSRGTARNPATPTESVALAFSATPTYAGAAGLLEAWAALPDVRVFRPTVLYAAVRALCLAGSGTHTLEQAAVRTREELRASGRPLPRRAVASTLLLKGLEAEAAVILHADQLNAANLYVAMTRGSTSLVVCSRSPVLAPRR
jgi:DNA helicase-2/ATP-dependent DNA helicase PcrA